jgi:hypothetical protein
LRAGGKASGCEQHAHYRSREGKASDLHGTKRRRELAPARVSV